MIDLVRASTIGEGEAVLGPFGVRRVTYADYTASGRSISFIEDFIRETVLPLYANTHTESSGTGLQTTRFREDARRVIKEAVGADDDYAVIFCGSGSTAAVNLLVNVLGLRIPDQLEDRFKLSGIIAAEDRPVVFIGPYEHHSNELPWRETIAHVIVIPADHDGHIDLGELERQLIHHIDRPLRIGSFSAASNVTGIITDVRAVSEMLHRHGALAFWDFAAAAPHMQVRVTETEPGAHDHFDAIFLSPHKLMGGPGTPGVLVARRDLFRNRVPTSPGGGTVAYVNPLEHHYLDDPERREEGGTPAIVESIRAGLVFQLKEAIGTEEIRRAESTMVRRAIERWRRVRGLEILGNPDAERLSIVSFVVKHEGRYLHHNFIVALLNDLFGIQSRGGCSCAGPYGHQLLGIDLDRSHEFEREISRGCEGIKPGWVRVSFNHLMTTRVFDFVLDAVELAATQGWRLLPLYHFRPESGLWTHRDGLHEAPLTLHDIHYEEGRMTYPSHRHREPESRLASYLEEAKLLFARPLDTAPPTPTVSDDFEHLRWFWLPEEIHETSSQPA